MCKLENIVARIDHGAAYAVDEDGNPTYVVDAGLYSARRADIWIYDCDCGFTSPDWDHVVGHLKQRANDGSY